MVNFSYFVVQRSIMYILLVRNLWSILISFYELAYKREEGKKFPVCDDI